LWPFSGQQESERASFAFFALCPDAATMQLDQSFGGSKPQAHAAKSPREMRFHLKEAFEYAWQVFGRDANAIIHHGYFNMTGDFIYTDCYMPA
jgi:hypothetical protein